MEKLKKEFLGAGEVKGVNFKQILSSEKAYMYELEDLETKQLRYEVFQRKASKPTTIILGGKEVSYEEKEIYPKSNSFGIWAWCYTNYNSALKKFNSISK